MSFGSSFWSSLHILTIVLNLFIREVLFFFISSSLTFLACETLESKNFFNCSYMAVFFFSLLCFLNTVSLNDNLFLILSFFSLSICDNFYEFCFYIYDIFYSETSSAEALSFPEKLLILSSVHKLEVSSSSLEEVLLHESDDNSSISLKSIGSNS